MDWTRSRAFLIFVMGVAAVVLGLIVLVGNPRDPSDLLAGGILAAGLGLVASVAPS
jgi:hypothetical protein